MYSLYLLIPNSWFIPLLHLYPLGTISLFLCLSLCFANKFICIIFSYITDKHDKISHDDYLSLSGLLHLLISSSTHVANGIILFFFMAECYILFLYIVLSEDFFTMENDYQQYFEMVYFIWFYWWLTYLQRYIPIKFV